MASTSSFAMPPRIKYDVFLSFRGLDTRRTFTSHLHAALIRRKVKTFIDYRLERGDEVGPALYKAIEESKISVIIFSEKYADSSWCLDELAYILICKERHGQHVIPIFYEVEPSHVRHQIGSYKDAFDKHVKRFKDDPDKVAKWKDALVDAANLSGFDSTSNTVRDNYDLVVQVVEDVLAKLNCESSMDLIGLIGAESRIQKILLELDIIPDDVRVRCVVLWGMGGIGKTTLADAVFHGVSSQFEAHCFLPNVRERSGNSKGGLPTQQLYDLRDVLLQELLGDKSLTISTRTIGAVYKERLSHGRVLVVLDDVNDSSQLTFLVGEVPFGSGSRIIITTRDKQPVTKTLVVKDVADHDVKMYEVEKFDEDESFLLLHSKAPKDCPEDSKVLKKVADYAAGIPLALDILSSSYYQSEGKEEFWDQLKKFPDDGLQKVYRVSYDGLHRKEQEIFLDIACFHKMKELSEAKRILDACGLFPNDGIKKLIDMSLISIKNDCIWMHDVIQEMGWEIVRQESPHNPGERSRLHNVEDVFRVLRGNKGTATVQCISGHTYKRLKLDPQAFTRMDSLRFLQLECTVYDDMANLEYLPDALRYLDWRFYPFQSLPSKFSPDNLVELHMSDNELRRLWGKSQNARNLKRINLSRSRHLVEVPDLSESVNIEWMELQQCECLVQVPSFKKFTKLTHLNLSYCDKLSILPDLPGNIEHLDCRSTAIEELPPSVWSLEKLRHLDLSFCRSIKNFSSSPWKMKSLKYLDLRSTEIETVPLSSFLCTSGIISLNLSYCPRLVSLPNDICKLKSLQKLDLYNCSSFINFPEIADPMEQLHYLSICCTEIEELPSNFGNLVALEELRLGGGRLKVLPSSFGNLVGLKELDLSLCTSLELLPHGFCNLKVLEQLSLRGCVKLKELPLSFTFSSLKELDLGGCKLLEEIPDCSTSFPALEVLNLSGTMIEKIPPSIKQVSGLKSLRVYGCKRLQSLPCLLQQLDATECTRLESVANSGTVHTQGLDQMLSSETLLFGGCVNLDRISRSYIMDDAHFRFMRMATDFVSLSLSHPYAMYPWSTTPSMDVHRLIPTPGVTSNVMVTCPGDEIPKWFTCQKEGSSLDVVLPRHWCNGNFLAIALCCVSGAPTLHLTRVLDVYECEMILKTNNGKTTYRHTYKTLSNESVETDHVVVYGEVHKIPDEAAKGSVEASFHFYRKVDFSKRLYDVKRCGVCFLYARSQDDDDDAQNLQRTSC